MRRYVHKGSLRTCFGTLVRQDDGQLRRGVACHVNNRTADQNGSRIDTELGKSQQINTILIGRLLMSLTEQGTTYLVQLREKRQ